MRPEKLDKDKHFRQKYSKYSYLNPPENRLSRNFGMLSKMSRHEMANRLKGEIDPATVKRVIID